MHKKCCPSRTIIFALTIIMLSATISAAGTISMQWDANTDADLAGYRVYYGNVSGNYDQSVDVGNVTSYTLNGLADCTMWYVAIKAYDTEGLESTNYSAEVSGWAQDGGVAIYVLACIKPGTSACCDGDIYRYDVEVCDAETSQCIFLAEHV